MGGIHELVGMMFLLTGCRFSELQKARWHQLDLHNRRWTIEHGKGAGRRGPKPRTVPLHRSLVPLLVRWRRECGSPDWLFPARGPSSTPYLSEATMRKVFAQLCEQAGISAVPHQARHSAATAVLEQTENLIVVRELLGHESVATTQIYTQVSEARLREAVDGLPA
jgi:integrase/recombinase XerC/integrase/recombinase XerD